MRAVGVRSRMGGFLGVYAWGFDGGEEVRAGAYGLRLRGRSSSRTRCWLLQCGQLGVKMSLVLGEADRSWNTVTAVA